MLNCTLVTVIWTWLLGWVRVLVASSRKSRYVELKLEVLESRVVPTTFYWNGSAGNGRMSDPNNYVPVGILPVPAPVAGDTIIFDGLNGPLANTPAFADPNLANNLTLILAPTYTGRLEIDTDLTVNSITDAASTITIMGGFTLEANQVGMTGGTINGIGGTLSLVGAGNAPGTMGITGPSTLAMSHLDIDTSSQLTIAANVTLDDFTLNNDGVVNWVDGRITAPTLAFNNFGTVVMTATGKTMSGGNIINNGEMIAALGSGGTCILSSDINNFGGA